MIVLIHPPVAKPCEPPAGIARISGALTSGRIGHTLLDLNLEAMLHMAGMDMPHEFSSGAWTKRALLHREQNIAKLRDKSLYQNLDRYKKAVREITRAFTAISPVGTAIGLADFKQEGLSPVRSRDLLTAAERPELNPFYPYFSRRLQQAFGEKSPLFAGISVNFLSQALTAFAIAGFIRREFPGLKVLMGGGLITSWSGNKGWDRPFAGLIDEFVSGPGEGPLLQILGMNADVNFRRPEYSGLPLDQYLSPGRILPYSASSGCYWNRCDFCPEKAEGNRYVSIPSGQVIADLKSLKEETGPALIHLLDNAISPALLESLCAEKIGVPWYGFARISGHLADPDFCVQLKKAGCVMLKLGIESGDQEILDRLSKGISLEMTSKVLRNLKNKGISTYIYLLFGTPAEDKNAAQKTLLFTAEHSDCIDYLNLAVFNMPACGTAHPGLETRGFSEGDLSLYTDFVHPAGWDRRKVRLFLDREFRRHPAIANILKNEVPVFTSNHAPFFVMEKSNNKSAAH